MRAMVSRWVSVAPYPSMWLKHPVQVVHEAFSIGPQTPPDALTGDTGEFVVEEKEGEVDTFLNRQLKERGERSLVYIR